MCDLIFIRLSVWVSVGCPGGVRGEVRTEVHVREAVRLQERRRPEAVVLERVEDVLRNRGAGAEAVRGRVT